MDFSDNATLQEELMRELSMKRARNHAPDLQATGACHWCDSSVPEGYKFCDVDCRDAHEARAKIERINGRKDVA